MSDSAIDSIAVPWDTAIDYKIVLFYRYVHIEDVHAVAEKVKRFCIEHSIMGRVLIAEEGVNGTFAGSYTSMDRFTAFMERDERFAKVDWKWSYCSPSGE